MKLKNDNIKFETIRFHKKRIYFWCGFVCVVVLLIVFIVGRSHARYRVTESIPLVNGTINYSLADLNIVAMTIDGESVDTITEGNYELTEESYCTVNGEEDSSISLSYDSSTQTLQVIPFTTKGTKCYLDFTKKVSVGETILANVTVNEGTPDFSKTATTDEGVFKAEDNLGTSYYFRGAVKNNYVQFAGYYWRIIRINGDGSIRMIYDGTSAHANGESSSDRQTGTSAYNSSYNASYYVGYTYQMNMQRPANKNGGTASTIKGVLDKWYTTNIVGKGLDDKVISTPGFCNDRSTASYDNWSTSSSFNYASYERVYTTRQPILQCSNNIDLYTTEVGLITADEVMFAGGTTSVSGNNKYYLYTGQAYWTMSPYESFNGRSFVFGLLSSGALYDGDSVNADILGVRPVINLSADVTFTGTGTMNDPYQVVGA